MTISIEDASAGRRLILARGAQALATALLPFGPRESFAQSVWPSKPVRIIVPFASGSFTETTARAVAAELHSQLGQPFVVEARGGAGSTIGSLAVAKANDGHTLLFTDNSFAVSTALYPSLPYDPLKEIVQVAQVAEAPAMLVVRNGLTVRTLKQLVELAQAKPGELNYGTGGQGSSAHLAMELFLDQERVHMSHIPYKGVAASLSDVVADRIDVGFSSVGTAGHLAKAGRVRALAISGKQRHPEYPDVPTFGEAGFPEYSMTFVFGFMAPGSTPEFVLEHLHKEIAVAVQKPRVRNVLQLAGAIPVTHSRADYRRLVTNEIAVWQRVISKARIKPA